MLRRDPCHPGFPVRWTSPRPAPRRVPARRPAAACAHRERQRAGEVPSAHSSGSSHFATQNSCPALLAGGRCSRRMARVPPARSVKNVNSLSLRCGVGQLGHSCAVRERRHRRARRLCATCGAWCGAVITADGSHGHCGAWHDGIQVFLGGDFHSIR